jgi:hypothetical protein
MGDMKTSEISSRLKAIFPDLIDWNPTDGEYLPANKDTLKNYIKIFKSPAWKEGVNECEEIARRLMCKVRDWELSQDYTLNQAIGVAFLTKHQGIEERHTINIAVDEENIYLFDMQTEALWIADPEQDNVYFVEM